MHYKMFLAVIDTVDCPGYNELNVPSTIILIELRV